jgi:asparagine synthase (glutamine-hydrolysing)
MCGVCGFMYFDFQRKAEYSTIKKMTDTLSHRGPDGEGYFVKNNVAMGHRRLTIIDLFTGDQPMYSRDKSVAIVFNGEIYNYIELRKELENLGYKFFSNSDTEVIIYAYLQWGYDCQNKFNGIWAFAIWDNRKKILFLSRDRVGEKPLYYGLFDGAFIFGSEIKSLFGFNNFPKDKYKDVLELYLTLGYVPAPNTFYKNIKVLLPGNYIIITSESYQQYEYWDLPELDEDNMKKNKTEIYEEFQSLLIDSVKIRMRSDVPFGAFLSGGLDSSTIVNCMTNVSKNPVHTFTLGFIDKKFDESKYAKLVADKFKCVHNEKIVLSEDGFIEKAIAETLQNFDEPFGDSSSILTSIISKFAGSKVKMVLTGDGGDELLSGYTSYQGEKFANQYQKIPNLIRTFFFSIMNVTRQCFKGNSRYNINRVINVLESSGKNFDERLINKVSWADSPTLKSILRGYHELIPIEDYINDFMRKCKYKDNFFKLLYYNFKCSLPDDILKKIDRSSMAYSLETRIPFLDHRLIESMTRVHKSIKMEGYQRKSILLKTFGKSLPGELLKLKKRGFVIPLREWFKEPRHQIIFESSIFDSKNINKIINENAEGKKDYGNLLWNILLLQNWLK